MRRAIRAAGARLFFLPKCSPDLNPFEQLFAKLKHWLRKAAERTTNAVCDAIGRILDSITSAECANYFANAGYAPNLDLSRSSPQSLRTAVQKSSTGSGGMIPLRAA